MRAHYLNDPQKELLPTLVSNALPVLFLATVLLVAAACTAAPGEKANPLDSTNWVLAGFGAPQSLQQLVPGTEITAEFRDGQVSGASGCNHYGGAYTVRGNALQIDEIASTAMLCPGDPIMQQEERYREALVSAGTFTLANERLIIHTAAGDLVFTPATPLPLEGTTWQLQGLMQQGALVSTWVDARITATFANGRLAGSAGCNNYFADYQIDGLTLTISAIGSTKMACDDERNQREDQFLAALAAVSSYETGRTALTLAGAGGQPLLLFQQVPLAVPELYGVVWQLVAFETAGGPLPAPRDTIITAQFIDDVVAGTGGCNPYAAGYHLAAEAFLLFIGELSRGTDSCAELIDQQERMYFQMLEAADSFSLEGDTLILYTTGGTLSFRRAPFTIYKPPFVALPDGTPCSLTTKDDPVIVDGRRRSYFCFRSGPEMVVLIGELQPAEQTWTAEKAILVGNDEDFTVQDITPIDVGLPQPSGGD